MTVTGRMRHYGIFYGLDGLPDEPFGVIHGNCQAEALRIALVTAGPQSPFSVRVPPVHELEPADLPHLRRVYAAASILVVQPVKAGYRDLPVGTAEVTALLAPGARVVPIPVLRWNALHPYQFLARNHTVPDPPLVPYHDLRIVAAAAQLPVPRFDAAQVCAVAQDTAQELRRRQRAADTLPGDDLFLAAGARGTNTLNHPGNPVLLGMAQRILERLAIPGTVGDPGRELLRSVITPIEAETLDALGLAGEPRRHWQIDGRDVSPAQVAATHTRWLQQHPEALALAVEVARNRLQQIGIAL